MQVRKKLRRIKRFAYLGALTGAVASARRMRDQRRDRVTVGQPAAWPPLEVATESPVAATERFAEAATRLDTFAATPADADAAPAEAEADDSRAAKGVDGASNDTGGDA